MTISKYSLKQRDLAKALYVCGKSESEIDELFNATPGTTTISFSRTCRNNQSYTRDSVLNIFKERARNSDITLADLLDQISFDYNQGKFKDLCLKFGIQYEEEDFSLPLIKKS